MSTPDTWAVGAAYEPYVGRWSRLVAAEFLPWLGVGAGRRWLDVGCGTGELTRAILSSAAPREVIGIDQSEGFLAYAGAQTSAARFEVADARALPFEASGFDAVVSGLVLNFVPEPERAVAEIARVVSPGGTVGVYVWDYADGMQLIRRFWDAAIALDPSAPDLDEGRRFPLCQSSDALAAAFSDFADVEPRAITVTTRFVDFDDYWSPFLGGQGPAPSYVSGLDEERRAALRERLRATLPTTDDGSIALTARAWAVRARR